MTLTDTRRRNVEATKPGRSTDAGHSPRRRTARRTTWQPVGARRRRRRAQRRSRGSAAAGLAVAVISLLGLGLTVIVAVLLVSSQQQSAPGAETERPVYAEPEPGADPVEQAVQTEQGGEYVPPQPLPGQPLRLAIPAVGIDVRVGSMAVPGDRRVDPPTPGSAYWLRDYSVLGASATGTGYIAGHTYRGAGEAVFNPLFDPETREARIHSGDAIEVTTPEGVTAYTITSVQNYDKHAVPDETELWQDVPGRLVLVACWYNGADPATANMVVYAERIAP